MSARRAGIVLGLDRVRDVLARMKVWTHGRHLWTRTIGSTVLGQGVDSLVFYPIAFYGVWSSDSLLAVLGFGLSRIRRRVIPRRLQRELCFVRHGGAKRCTWCCRFYHFTHRRHDAVEFPDSWLPNALSSRAARARTDSLDKSVSALSYDEALRCAPPLETARRTRRY